MSDRLFQTSADGTRVGKRVRAAGWTNHPDLDLARSDGGVSVEACVACLPFFAAGLRCCRAKRGGQCGGVLALLCFRVAMLQGLACFGAQNIKSLVISLILNVDDSLNSLRMNNLSYHFICRTSMFTSLFLM